MSYTWTNGELITAEKLNNTGSGGALICHLVPYEEGYENQRRLDKTFKEIFDAILSGTPVYLAFSRDDGSSCIYSIANIEIYDSSDGCYIQFINLYFNFLNGAPNDYPIEDMD